MSPELHGVELADIPNTPYFAGIDVRVPLDIQSVARLAGLPASEVLALNPSHKSLYISGKGKPAVLLPADRIEVFAQKIAVYPLKGKQMNKFAEPKLIRKSVVGFKLREERPL